MQPQVAFAIGIAGGLAVLAVGAVYAGRAEGAIYAVAALGFAALGLMLLADLLLAASLTQPASIGFTGPALALAALQIGGISLALLALVLMLMGSLTGLVWAARHHHPGDLAVPGLALAAQLAGMALTLAGIFGWVPAVLDWAPLVAGTRGNILPLASIGLGTLAAALITFWAVPIVRQGTRSQSWRATASGPQV